MRYIEVDSIIAKIKAEHCDKCKHDDRCFYCDIDKVLLELEEADDADVVEMKHGEWEQMGNGLANCSNCGMIFEALPTLYVFERKNVFCPNCGAKMDGRRKETIAYTKEKHSKKEDVCGITHLPCCYCQPVCGSKKTIKISF